MGNNQQLEAGHEYLIKGKMEVNYYNKVLKTKIANRWRCEKNIRVLKRFLAFYTNFLQLVF